jgi:ABC-type dipeptide/oligopeptide/nickel transport system permease subunit
MEEAQANGQLLARPTGLWRGAWRRLLRRKGGVIGLVIIGSMVTVALLAPLIAPHDPNEDFIGDPGIERRASPCVHLFGCDEGTPQHVMGLDGNFRIAIVAALGPGLRNTLLAIAIVSIPAYARVMRAGVLSVKELDFVAASRALGAGKLRILWTRVVPNALTPLVVISTLGIATAILDAAAFGFLGLGAQPPQAEWGAMLADERNQLFTAPHLIFFPGIAIMLTVLGFNLLGDGLRDALDPSLSD